MSLRIDSEISFRGEVIHRHSSTAESLAAVVRSIETLQTEAGAFLGTRIVYDKANGLYGAATASASGKKKKSRRLSHDGDDDGDDDDAEDEDEDDVDDDAGDTTADAHQAPAASSTQVKMAIDSAKSASAPPPKKKK